MGLFVPMVGVVLWLIMAVFLTGSPGVHVALAVTAVVVLLSYFASWVFEVEVRDDAQGGKSVSTVLRSALGRSHVRVFRGVQSCAVYSWPSQSDHLPAEHMLVGTLREGLRVELLHNADGYAREVALAERDFVELAQAINGKPTRPIETDGSPVANGTAISTDAYIRSIGS